MQSNFYVNQVINIEPSRRTVQTNNQQRKLKRTEPLSKINFMGDQLDADRDDDTCVSEVTAWKFVSSLTAHDQISRTESIHIYDFSVPWKIDDDV